MSPDPRIPTIAAVLGSAGARHAARCVAWAEEHNRRTNGWAAPASVRAVRGLLEAAAAWDDELRAPAIAEGRGSADVPLVAVLPASMSMGSPASPVEWIGTKEAAAMLGCTDRNVRDLAARGSLTGRYLGRRLVLDRLQVDELAEVRRALAARRAGGAA